MAVTDLAILILQQIGPVAVKHARLAALERRAMLARVDALAGCFDAVNLHGRIIEEGMEKAHRIGAATDTGNDGIGQPPLALQHLCLCLAPDHGLEVAHHCRIGMGTGDSADQIVGVLDIRYPVPQRFVHRIFQRARAGSNRNNFRAEKLHAEDVRLLPFNVGCAHVDDTGKAEACANGCGRHTMLARTRFRDDARLAHAPRKQDLAKAVIDLMAAGMVQLVTLEIDFRAAIPARRSSDTTEMFRQPLGEIERARATHIVALHEIDFCLKGGIGFRRLIGFFKIEHERHQCFGDKASAEYAETTPFIRSVSQGVWCRRAQGFSLSICLLLSAAFTGLQAALAALMKASMSPGDFRPGAVSTPDETSTVFAPVTRIASPTLSGVRPPDSIQGISGRCPAISDQSKTRPFPPGNAFAIDLGG